MSLSDPRCLNCRAGTCIVHVRVTERLAEAMFGMSRAEARARARLLAGKTPTWTPGDPCAACGSTDTGWDAALGAHCRTCQRSDADE